jgi:hypothetical protein
VLSGILRSREGGKAALVPSHVPTALSSGTKYRRRSRPPRHHPVSLTRSRYLHITMWGLDRLSSYSTPSGMPPSRRDSYSPAPRRGYPSSGPGPLPPRPGLVPRASSLSLISPGASTTSLPSTARVPNGAPRRRATGGAPHHGPDPIQVLASIMGGLPRKPLVSSGERNKDFPQKPEAVLEDIDFGGLSLQDFAAQAPLEHKRITSVHTYSAQSVEECMCSPLASRRFAHRDCRRQGEGQV